MLGSGEYMQVANAMEWSDSLKQSGSSRMNMNMMHVGPSTCRVVSNNQGTLAYTLLQLVDTSNLALGKEQTNRNYKANGNYKYYIPSVKEYATDLA